GALGVFGMFVVMSNELNTPKILACPSEYQTTRSSTQPASVWGNSGTVAPITMGFFSDNQSSYFVGVDAIDTYPQMLLAGDHNMGLQAASGTASAGVPVSGSTIWGDSGGTPRNFAIAR